MGWRGNGEGMLGSGKVRQGYKKKATLTWSGWTQGVELGDVVYRDTPGQEMKKGTFRRRGQKKGVGEWYEGRRGIGKGIWRVDWEQGMDSCNIKSHWYIKYVRYLLGMCHTSQQPRTWTKHSLHCFVQLTIHYLPRIIIDRQIFEFGGCAMSQTEAER